MRPKHLWAPPSWPPTANSPTSSAVPPFPIRLLSSVTREGDRRVGADVPYVHPAHPHSPAVDGAASEVGEGLRCLRRPRPGAPQPPPLLPPQSPLPLPSPLPRLGPREEMEKVQRTRTSCGGTASRCRSCWSTSLWSAPWRPSPQSSSARRLASPTHPASSPSPLSSLAFPVPSKGRNGVGCQALPLPGQPRHVGGEAA